VGRSLLAAERQLAAGEDVEFMRAKVAMAAFYAEHLLTRAAVLRDAVVAGSAGVACFPAVACWAKGPGRTAAPAVRMSETVGRRTPPRHGPSHAK
jgi:hypothetical protein